MIRRSPAALLLCWCLLLSVAMSEGSRLAAAPVAGRGVPSNGYFVNFFTLYDGRYRDALSIFQAEGRSAIKTVDSRWIDSICYHTMTGECYYQMGQLPEALEHYDAALNLYVAFYDWMIRVTFPPVVQPSAARVNIPWGQSKRGAFAGRFPSTMPVAQGRLNNNQIVKQGGAVQSPVLIEISVSEIVRATSLAMRRRHELMGPACALDRLSLDLLDRFTRRPGPGNHWSQAWIDLEVGLAYSAIGGTVQAESALKRSLVVGGQFDHPLTSVALLELGRMAFEAGNFQAAASYAEEATYAAATYLDLGVLEEAFRLGQTTHLVTNQKDLYPPLLPAMAWARANGYRQLQAVLSLLAAENMVALGRTADANTLLADARPVIGRRDMGRGIVGNRMNYVTALVAYQAGNMSAGDAALATVLDFQRSASLRGFQIAAAERVLHNDESGRQTMMIYDTLLRDPTPLEWYLDPIESLAMSSSPNFPAMERWFEAALRRKEPERAQDIADIIRRRRFLATLPLGGRLMSLRWLLEGPKELLSQQATLDRQDLLAKFPEYAQLAAEGRKTSARLLADAPVANGPARREQGDLFASLSSTSAQQEKLLREMAVRRNNVECVFPPQRRFKEVQASLHKGQVVLAFFSTTRGVYAVLFSRDKVANWRIASPERLRKQTSTLLREMGNWDQNHQLAPADLSKEKWKASAREVLALLLDKSNVDLAGKFDELVIVPDGFLWYLPFEALPVGKQAEPLISRVRIRYAPTLGLAVPFSTATQAQPRVAVVVGKLFPQHDPSVARRAFEQLNHALPGAVALTGNLVTSSSLYRLLFDGIVVLDDVEPVSSGPYDWSPTQLDRSKTGGSLASWFALPWGGPSLMVLPGYHSAAENGMKKNGTGSDLFLSLCGLMASGSRTVLVSRWRTGGQSSFDLVREFTQELPHMPPADAWQRAVQVVSENPLDLDREPRVKRTRPEEIAPAAKHPFFWSGYMLVDSGAPDRKGGEPEPPPPAEEKPVKRPDTGKPPPPADGDVAPIE